MFFGASNFNQDISS
ncbi:hypothetical protein JIY74_30150 [Vibrio harveyi]|nr:hypothetical protein [Vibrio harveyi]